MPVSSVSKQVLVSPVPRRWGWSLVDTLPAASLLVPTAMLVLVGWLSWRAAMTEAFESSLRTAEAAAEYGERALEGHVIMAGRVNDRLRGLTDAQIRAQEEQLSGELARLVQEASADPLAFVIDRNGSTLVASSMYPVSRASLADRDYFRALSGPNPPSLFITSLFRGRFDNLLLFSVARPRRASGDPPDGNGFEGVVAVSVSPNALAENLRRLVTPPGYLGLVREDGYTLVRTAGEQTIFPPVPPSSPFHGVVARGERSATYLGLNTADGTPVLTALRRLDNFPIYAAALYPRSAVVAAWRETMLSHLILGVPATLALFTLSLLARRSQQRLTEANIRLRLDARLSETRLSRAEQLGLFGMFEIDFRTGENFRSAEYMAVQGLPAQAQMESHEHWVRRLHPEDRARAERVMLAAVAPGSGQTDYAQTYRIITPEGRVKWIAARAEIERDAEGHAVAMRGAHVDVTSLREAELALAESDARLRLAQEAAGIGTWEWQQDGETRLSRRMLELWGFDRDGPQPGVDAVLARIHPDDRRRIRRETKAALDGGVLRTECRVVRPDDAGQRPIWVMLRASAQCDRPPARLIGIGYDVTERKQAEAEAELLAHEVEHRAKNALTVVTGLLRVTQAETVERFAEVMEERVRALSNTMALLGRNRFRGASFLALLEHELRPYGDAVVLEGEDVMLPPDVAQPLSMALHELATNAAKYGALSLAGGRLRLAWWLEGRTLAMEWEELGGPAVAAPPEHEGFGSMLISQTFADKLGGGVEREWRREGLFCRIRLELAPG